ncbi:MAG: UDP-N-acetylmuramoyl-L-alanyl-D-glutamate--2,6-diaminopimelate ligase [Pseudomonadota bacterium]|nr:UDP-N-acetylmuramoyl-L-alanyl-D-glutamate--2,6-diaminopimelate ligase [Pseudomonadota bacterium]
MSAMHARTMRLAELLPDVAGIPADLHIGGLVQDSRELRAGDAFVAIGGFGTHGLHFVEQVRARGASAILFEPPAPADTPAPADAFAVPGLRARLGEMADRFHDRASAAMAVVGVTGTNGKTSSVQLLAQAWSLRGKTAGTVGTLGAGLYGETVATGFTTPLVLRMHAMLAELRAAGAQAIAIEVSSHALDQGRVDGVHFDVAVFTNLTRDHLDYHGDMAAYGKAKARLFAWPGLRAAVVNLDDDFGRELHASLTAPSSLAEATATAPLTPTLSPGGEAVGEEGAINLLRVFGLSSRGNGNATVRADELHLDAAGIAFELVCSGESHPVRSSLLGRFNVDNLLAVAGALHALGDAPVDIAATLSQLQPIHGRMNRLGGDLMADGSRRPLVVIDYAHTPDALEQALASLRVHAQARLICVFGCGGERDRGKRPQMAAVAEANADVVIVTDDNPRGEDGDMIVAEIMAGFAHRQHIIMQRDRAAAIARAIGEAGPDDIVLIAGKGHESCQEIDGIQHPFDDTEIARAQLAARAPHMDVQGSRAQDAQERP